VDSPAGENKRVRAAAIMVTAGGTQNATGETDMDIISAIIDGVLSGLVDLIVGLILGLFGAA
jgi:hypothetical protein